MSIHSLPDLCLVTIFSRVPLVDRLRAGQVCSRWRWIRSIVTSKQHCLTILVGANAFKSIESSRFDYPAPFRAHLLNDDGTPMFKPKTLCEWSSLQVDLLETKNVFGLANLFSNIRTLEIAMRDVDLNQLLMVAVLFEFFADKIVTLKVHCDLNYRYCSNVPQYISRQLFNTINSMSSLKHLTLEFGSSFSLSTYDLVPGFVASDETKSIDLSIISQLDEFNFYSEDDDKINVMFDSSQRYAQNSQGPLRIQFGYFKVNYDLSMFDLQFYHRFYSLISNINSSKMNIFCTRFKSIARVELEWDMENITIRQFFRNIAQLTQLVHLKLHLWFSQIFPDESDDLLSQLPSVKSFDIKIDFSTKHDILSLLNIPWTFPNVQVIGLDIADDGYNCDICEYHQYSSSEDEDKKEQHSVKRNNVLKRCLQRVPIPLRQCAQLHTIAQFDVKPFQVAKLPLTKEDLMQTIELKYIGYGYN